MTSSGSSANVLQDAEEAPVPDSGILNRNIHYDEPSRKDTFNGRASLKRSRWKRIKKFVAGQESDWWFASTAIPLLAATIGPLANVLSIAALVTYWRENIYIDGQFVGDFDGVAFKDPRWCYWLNVASLIFGFLGNLFLLFNFTQRVRYIIALPMTIILWYLATGFLIGITVSMQIYAPPNRPYETYTQGFWCAVVAAALYLVCSMILMINMLGYFLGHYPATFALTDAQRTLILQTMLFFIWLAGGAAVFSRVEANDGQGAEWTFTDSLYFCDVTILTVGFGDLYPTNDLGRGLVFPYSVGGTIMLGLVISSLVKFMEEIGEEKIIQKHLDRTRLRTIDRTVTSSLDLRQREEEKKTQKQLRNRGHIDPASISRPIEARPAASSRHPGQLLHRVTKLAPTFRQPKLVLLREERDRFNAMRHIQASTTRFKKWTALTVSVTLFLILWCVGAVVFWQCEKDSQNMTYFRALYFCYVSLLTIGYGDLSPKTNPGRVAFIVWSLIAVPTMTILVSDMGDTVIGGFKRLSDSLADFTILPKYGIWRSFVERHPWLLNWLQERIAARAAKRRLKRGFETGPVAGDVEEPDDSEPPNIESLATAVEEDAEGKAPTHTEISRKLAIGIKRVAGDLKENPPKRYAYEEWVEFTRLIRYTKRSGVEEVEEEEEEEGLVEWDWIGEDSPLMTGLSESEFLMEKLTECFVRFTKKCEVIERPSDCNEKKREEAKPEVDGEMHIERQRSRDRP